VIVVVSGNPRPGSRTHALAVAVGQRLAHRSGQPEPHVVDVAALGARLLVPGDPEVAAALAAVRRGDLLLVATPTYKASYTGVLKVLFDGLPPGALAGRTAAALVTAAVPAQAARAVDKLTDLLTELGAACIPADLTVTEDRLADSAAIAATATVLADLIGWTGPVPSG
jgi:FMN reductase